MRTPTRTQDVRCTVTWVSVLCTLHVRYTYTNQDTGCKVHNYMSLSSLHSTCERYIHQPGHRMKGAQLHEPQFSTCERCVQQPEHRMWGEQLYEPQFSTCERCIQQPGHRMWGAQLHESRFSVLYTWEIYTPTRTQVVRWTVTWVSVLCTLHVRDTYSNQDTGCEVHSYMSLSSLHVRDAYSIQDTGCEVHSYMSLSSLYSTRERYIHQPGHRMWGKQLHESQFSALYMLEIHTPTSPQNVRCTVSRVSVLWSLHVSDTYTNQDTGCEVNSYMSLSSGVIVCEKRVLILTD